MKNTITPEAQVRNLSEMIDRAARNPLKTYNADDNEAFRHKVKHVLLKDENGKTEGLLAFCARSGLGPSQAEFMTEDEITSFVDAAMQRRADDVIEQSEGWHKKVTIPAHFTI